MRILCLSKILLLTNRFIRSLSLNNVGHIRLTDCIELLEDMEKRGLLDMNKVRICLCHH